MIADDLVTQRDLDAALRLTREYVYGGGEPYAPEVMTFARLLAAHRLELHDELRRERRDVEQELHAQIAYLQDELSAARER